ncbi:MAG: 4Fe-4S binding protein [Alphaproteobacteria bacterium]|uniref:4Fe-4S binding protein n=1 Tax=Candidatus Nitrobium versatile TaxID=2884831 RepID=A0A953JC77_9BACT|nr:4Fe-4S binding protein [Candidatus Nitrobium versatile]
MRIKRKIVEIDEERCNGCGQCVPNCAEGALQIVDGKVRLVSEIYCDGLGACLGNCPQDAIRIVEREAEAFDEEATEHYLKEKAEREKKEAIPAPAPHGSGCPSSRIQMFGGSSPCAVANKPVAQAASASALSHWPVQIRLVPPTAPFLRGAHLLVAADCTPVAYPDFQRDFLRNKVVMIGCPKFDNADEYLQKFADIFRTADIKSVTVAIMEVPCCSRLPMIVERGMAVSGKKIPVEVVVISTRGEIINRQAIAI